MPDLFNDLRNSVSSAAIAASTNENTSNNGKGKKRGPYKKRIGTRAEFIRMHELLKEHLHKVEGTDYWEYDPGWSDGRIASAVSPSLNAGHTQHLRNELFGPVRRGSSNTVQERMKRLEEVFNKLAEEIGSELRIALE